MSRFSIVRSLLPNQRIQNSMVQLRRALASSSMNASLLNIPETKITILPNGMRVASENLNMETVTVGVWIDAGSRDESKEKNGVAHFLEHMSFKGTKKRSMKDIEFEIENMGGHLNAYTSREQTTYYAKVFKKDTAHAIEILSDILQNPTLNLQDIQNERATILREMEEVENQTEEHVFDLLHEQVFKDSELGRTILGPSENIATISKHDILEFIKQNYTGPRMVLAAAGGVDHDELVELGKKTFSNLSPSLHHRVAKGKTNFHSRELRVLKDDKPYPHVAIAFEGISWTNPTFFDFMVAQMAIGTWDRSMGFAKGQSTRLAERFSSRDCCSFFNGFNTCYADTGLFGVYLIGSEKEKINEMIQITQEELHRIAHHITDEEVEKNKRKLFASLSMQLDGSTQICEDIGRQLITYGRRITPIEMYTRLQAVTTQSVKEVLSKCMHNKKPCVVAYGPIGHLGDISWNI